MYSDKNFNIKPRYVEHLPGSNPGTRAELDDVFPEIVGGLLHGFSIFLQIVLGLVGVVVLISAALILVAFLAWCWSWTLPQHKPLTQRRDHVDIQEVRGSSARPVGGERSSDPQPGRSTPTQTGAQDASQDEVGLKGRGASAPIFQWVCGRN